MNAEQIKEELINDLIATKEEELSKVYGGYGCEPGCSGIRIGCGPDYCIGPCPKNCLDECMAAPSCKGLVAIK